MKVFQIIYEYEDKDSLIEQINYVTGPDIGTVASHCQKHADGYRKDIKSVRYLFNIVEHIESE